MDAFFNCDLSSKTTAFPHFWKHTIGSGHATLALRADWQAQLTKCKEELGFKHVRFHGILSSMMDTLTTEKGKPYYSFFNADCIFDFLLSIDLKPFVELSFMPESLASGHKTVFHYHSNVTPPKSYKEWNNLLNKLITHWVDRYGVKEVRQWFFEIWNEPNLKSFWQGKQAEYFKLFQCSVGAIKDVDNQLKVGGPATAKNAWIRDFVNYCEKHNLPYDFISTHHYPTDAFGVPGDDTPEQLAMSRRSIMREEAQNVFSQANGTPVYYTEWSSSSNPRDTMHDEPYAAAFCTKTIMEAARLVEGYSFWTFSDIFQENYFPSKPFQGGFGLLTIHGIPKPTYRAYQLLNDIGTQQFLVDGTHPTVDAWVIRKNHSSVTILLTNHALPKHPLDPTKVFINLENTTRKCVATIQRIDETHANPRKAWIEMGKPEYLSSKDVEYLMKVSALKKETIQVIYRNNKHGLKLVMPPHSVVAITLSFSS